MGIISVYLFCIILFPVASLYGFKRRTCAGALLEKEDTMYLRGVAAWFVVIAHYTANIGDVIPNDIFGRIFSFAMGQLGGIGVLVFFFVSGYGIYASYASRRPGWDFLWKRIKGVYFPYLIIKFLLIVLQLVVTGKCEFSLGRLLSVSFAEDWFVHVILLQYLSFFIVGKWLGTRKIVLYSFLINIVYSVVFLYEGKVDHWINALWLFTFGMACAKYQKRILTIFDKAIWIKITACLILFGVTRYIFAINKGAAWANVFKTLGGLFLCISMCGVLRGVMPGSGIMKYFGKRSLYLYMVHLGVWPFIEIEDVIMHYWIAVGASVVITEAIYRLVLFLEGSFRGRKCSNQFEHTTER